MTANHRIELAKYGRKIEGETKSSLRRIKNDSAEVLLDTIFKDEFLRTTMTRITTVYEHIVDEILLGQTSLVSTTFNPFRFVSSTPMHAIESDFVAPVSRPPVQKSPNQPENQTYVELANSEANSTLNIPELPSNFGQSILRSGDVIPDVELQPQLNSFLNSCLNIDHDAPSNGVLQNGEPASESDFVAPVCRSEIQTDVQSIIPESNNTLNIPDLPSYFGQSMLRSGDVIPDVELQPQLDSFLNSCLNIDHDAPSDGVLQNSESASVNPNNEFETNAVTVEDDTHALIAEAPQCRFGTPFIAPEEVLENGISEPQPVLIGANDNSCEPNVVEEIPCENVINLAPVYDDIVDLTAQCEASNSSNADSNEGKKRQKSVRRSKRKTPFQVSDLEKSSKKRKVEDVSAPVREKDGKFHCEVCEYWTSRRIDLKRHNLVHTGEKPFKCEKCAQAFNIKQNLSIHMRTHEKHLKFECAICLQRFELQEAKDSHQDRCNKRSYECYVCRSYSTIHKSNLVYHFRQHNGEKPFQCSHCSERFTLKTHLTLHIMRHHK